MEGSASALVKLVIGFASANALHPIVVLFDNDTARTMEMEKLFAEREKFSANIKILKLPDITLARNYPTKSPSGMRKLNVNGLACGIEMYTGVGALTKNNAFVPVLWKGYNNKKNNIRVRFPKNHMCRRNSD